MLNLLYMSTRGPPPPAARVSHIAPPPVPTRGALKWARDVPSGPFDRFSPKIKIVVAATEQITGLTGHSITGWVGRDLVEYLRYDRYSYIY